MKRKNYTLVGVDGNAFSVMGYVSRAMKETGFTRDEINEYLEDAKSSDYNYLIYASLMMIEKCNQM